MSTRFLDGPLAGVALQLRRSPVFLRAVLNANGEADALDPVGDEPLADDRVAAYRRASFGGAYFLDWTEKGRRRGGRFAIATYAVVAEQPPDEVMRDRAQWQRWCWVQWQGRVPAD